jgi:RND family efflux transporter MFP subunit
MSNVHADTDRIELGLGVALLVLALFGLAGCGRGSAQGENGGGAAPEERAAIAVRTVAAVAEQQPVTLTLDGTLVADEESRVTSVVPGRVIEVLVERGSVVEENAPLVRLRDVDYRLQAAAARAQLDQARARLGLEDQTSAPRPAAEMPEVRAAQADAELAESNARRAEELAQRGVLAAQGLEEARSRAASARERYQTALQNARASITALSSARVALSQASTSANEATVRAPFAGEIAERMVSVGEYVSPQSPVVTLVRTDPLRIELQVPQQHLMDVRAGQRVTLVVDAVPDRTFEAVVRYVSAAVRTETRGLTVEAVVPNPDRVLRPGLFAQARLSTGGTREVAVVPPDAVYTQAGVDRVFVVEGGRVEERVVSVSDRTSERVVIAEGVRAGEMVAIDSLDQLADGVAVTVEAGSAAPAVPAPTAAGTGTGTGTDTGSGAAAVPSEG